MKNKNTIPQSFQPDILAALIGDRVRYDEFIHHLHEDSFPNDGYRWIFTTLKSHVLVHDELPDCKAFEHHAESVSSVGLRTQILNECLPTIVSVVTPSNFTIAMIRKYVLNERARKLLWQLTDDLENNCDNFRDRMHQFLLSERRNIAHVSLMTVEEALTDPSLTEPIERVSPWLSWEGMISLFAAREKLGKTTLAITDAIKATDNAKTVLWLSADEGVRQQVYRLKQLGCRSSRFFMTNPCPKSWEEASSLVERCNPDVVYVDSLSSFLTTTSHNVPATNEGERWHHVVNRFREWTVDGKRAVVLIHHGRKEDGTARGSTGITAASDMNITFKVLDNQRELKYLGRLDGETAPTIEYRGPDQLCEEIQGPMTKVEKAKEFLKNFLGDGEKLAKNVRKAAELNEIANTTLERAKRDLGIVSVNNGAKTTWRLPQSQSPIEQLMYQKSTNLG